MKVDTPIALLSQAQYETDMTPSQQRILNIFRLIKASDIDITTLLHAVKP